jgi:hypothetical protein
VAFGKIGPGKTDKHVFEKFQVFTAVLLKIEDLCGYAMSSGKQLQTFRRIEVLLPSGSSGPRR